MKHKNLLLLALYVGIGLLLGALVTDATFQIKLERYGNAIVDLCIVSFVMFAVAIILKAGKS